MCTEAQNSKGTKKMYSNCNFPLLVCDSTTMSGAKQITTGTCVYPSGGFYTYII